MKYLHFTSTEHLCVRKATSGTTWQLSRPGNGCSLFSNSPAPSGRPWSFSHCRETVGHSVSFFLTSLFHFQPLLSYFCHFSLYLAAFISHIPLFSSSYFLVCALSCTLLPSVSFCFLLSLSLFLYHFWPALLLLLPLSSAALWLFLIIQHHVALCSPHLDHIILKSEGTALLFQWGLVRCLEEKNGSRRRKKRCHPQPSQRDECTLTKPPL